MLGLPPATRARSRASCALLAGRGDGRAARPADRGQPARRSPATRVTHRARRAARPRACASTASSTCPQADSLFQKRRRARRARSRRRRPTTSCCCPRRCRTVRAPLAAARADLVAHAGPRRPRAPTCPAARARRSRGVSGERAQPRGAARRRRARRRQPRRGARQARAATRSTPQLLFLFLGVPGAIARRPAHRVDRRRGRRAPAPRRRRCCARAARRRASSSALALAEAALAGVRRRRARARASRCCVGARRVRHRELRRQHAAGAAVGGRRRRSPASRIAAAAIALPAWRDARALTVARPARRSRAARARAAVGALRPRLRRARRRRRSCTGRPSRNGYQLVLAPEGVPQVSVNWYALARRRCWPGSAPGCSPTGSPTLAAARAGAGRSRARCDPLAGALAATVAATMSRQRRLLARAVALVALDRRVRRLDRGLQRHLPAAGRGRRAAHQRRRRHRHRVARRERRPRRRRAGSPALPGVRSVEPLQHRFAYVGADLQDLYGVRPHTIGARRQAPGRLVPGRHAPTQLMATLASAARRRPGQRRDRHDFQLQPGRPAAPAAAGRRAPGRYTTVPVPLRRRRQGVPHRADATLPRRQRRATSRRRPAATPSARSSSQTGGTEPARRRRAAAAHARHRRPGHRHRRPSARSSAPT